MRPYFSRSLNHAKSLETILRDQDKASLEAFAIRCGTYQAMIAAARDACVDIDDLEEQLADI